MIAIIKKMTAKRTLAMMNEVQCNKIRNKKRKTHIECERCKRQMQWNGTKKQNKCMNEVVGDYSDDRNQNEGNPQLSTLRQQLGTTNAIPKNEINERNKNLIHQGQLDDKKRKDCIRLLQLNTKGFGPDDEEKVEMMIKAVKRYGINGILLSSPDRKWTSSKIRQKFRSINKEVEVIAQNRDQETRREKEFLPGRTMSMLMGRLAGTKTKDKEKKDPLG